MSDYLLRMNVRGARLACALVCLALLAACGKSGESKAPATQVAAKVNGDEISVHQINQALSRSGRIAPEQAVAAGKQVLEGLIDQQLLIQKSLEKKLDRDPEVLNAIEASRRQILSQAYLEKSVTGGLGRPAPEEVKKYYDAHPELFAQRRIYRLQELIAAVSPEQLKVLRAEVDKTKDLNDIARWMRNGNIRFSGNAAVRAAEQLPLESLPKLAQMKDGDLAVTEGNGSVTVMQVAASQSVPLSEKEATPFIEQYLVNQKRIALAGAEMKQLRQTAKLEYVGDFAKPAADATAKGAPVPSPAAEPTPVSGASVIDKGVSGLK